MNHLSQVCPQTRSLIQEAVIKKGLSLKRIIKSLFGFSSESKQNCDSNYLKIFNFIQTEIKDFRPISPSKTRKRFFPHIREHEWETILDNYFPGLGEKKMNEIIQGKTFLPDTCCLACQKVLFQNRPIPGLSQINNIPVIVDEVQFMNEQKDIELIIKANLNEGNNYLYVVKEENPRNNELNVFRKCIKGIKMSEASYRKKHKKVNSILSQIVPEGVDFKVQFVPVVSHPSQNQENSLKSLFVIRVHLQKKIQDYFRIFPSINQNIYITSEKLKKICPTKNFGNKKIGELSNQFKYSYLQQKCKGKREKNKTLDEKYHHQIKNPLLLKEFLDWKVEITSVVSNRYDKYFFGTINGHSFEERQLIIRNFVKHLQKQRVYIFRIQMACSRYQSKKANTVFLLNIEQGEFQQVEQLFNSFTVNKKLYIMMPTVIRRVDFDDRIQSFQVEMRKLYEQYVGSLPLNDNDFQDIQSQIMYSSDKVYQKIENKAISCLAAIAFRCLSLRPIFMPEDYKDLNSMQWFTHYELC